MLTTYKNIEKNLQELMIIGFEYSTYSSLCINLENFINKIPQKINNYYKIINKKNNNINKKYIKTIINNSSYNKFYSTLLLLTKLKVKIKKSQFTQLINYVGIVNKNINNSILFSNLINGFLFQHYIYSCFSARNSILSTGLATADIGYLMRKLTECLRSLYIKESFCYSPSTIKYKNILTYENKHYNITYTYKPFLCYSLKNLCAKCSSINITNKNIIGYNKGIITSQSICEPRLQSALRTFHIGCLKTHMNTTIINIHTNNIYINNYNKLKKVNNIIKYKKKLKSNKNKSIIFTKKRTNIKYNHYITKLNKSLINSLKTIDYKNIYYSNTLINVFNKTTNSIKSYSIIT